MCVSVSMDLDGMCVNVGGVRVCGCGWCVCVCVCVLCALCVCVDVRAYLYVCCHLKSISDTYA